MGAMLLRDTRKHQRFGGVLNEIGRYKYIMAHVRSQQKFQLSGKWNKQRNHTNNATNKPFNMKQGPSQPEKYFKSRFEDTYKDLRFAGGSYILWIQYTTKSWLGMKTKSVTMK